MQDSTVLLWSLLLIVGFPLCVVILGEVIQRQSRRRPALGKTLQIFRNLVLPVLTFLLFAQHVLKLDVNDRGFKTLQTVFLICVIHGSLSLLNALLFEQAGANTWRSRVPKLLIDLSRLILILVGTAVVAAAIWNADLAGVATALGVSSIVIGLALQDTLGSIMSGIALLFERPFTVGDWIRVGEIVGQVLDMSWRSVRILTLDREMIIIPHKFISNEVIRNYNQPHRIHAERVKIGFSYNDPPNKALQVLRETAIATPGILSRPEPQAFTLGYEDSAILYEVKFCIDDYGQLETIRSEFMTRLWYAAQRHQLNIPFPIRTLYHFHGPTTNAQSTQQKFTDRLQSLPTSIPIDLQADTMPNSGITLQHFAKGEQIIFQGSQSEHLYIIVSGQACMGYIDAMGQEREVLILQPGELFGVMVLFSGEASPVSVSAIEDLEVMTLELSVVNQMIDRQPSFAREIAQVQAIRQRALQVAYETERLEHQERESNGNIIINSVPSPGVEQQSS
jgi:small-conductance mechanosensitive channel